MAQGVDDLHRGEVRFLGRVEREKVSATEHLGKGKRDNLAGDTLSSTLKRGSVPGDHGKLPSRSEVFVFSLSST